MPAAPRAASPVVEGLPGGDPAARLPAGRPERGLRSVGAGGPPGTQTVPAVPYAPTAAAAGRTGRRSPPPLPRRDRRSGPAGSAAGAEVPGCGSRRAPARGPCRSR
ncbi:hypothetical protein GCM10010240_57720 [Streptomyces griseoviridis]|nr:hypothetical protein GCM10010240_57720 [Streptomyces griseoviridis]